MATVMILLKIAATNKLINAATAIKLMKLPQQINDHFDINDEYWKFCSGSFFNV